MKKIKKVIENKDGEKVIKVSLSTVLYGLGIVLVFLIGLGSVLAYATDSAIGKQIAAKISIVMPFPAAIVDHRHVVLLKDLENNLVSVQQFYQTQDFASEGLRVDFTTEDGKKRLEIKKRELLDKMVEDKIIEILAKRRGIVITDAQVDKAVNSKLSEYGTSDDVKKDLARSYGWSMEDFKQRVVFPSMYQQALEKSVLSESTGDSIAKDKIGKAQAQLQSGKDFAQVVSLYSEGSSRDNIGELGWVKRDQVLPELQDALFGNKELVKNTVIESSIGFHILDIEGKKKDNGQDVVKLRQIFVAKNTFAGWLEQQKKQIAVSIPVKEFKWNQQVGTVEFSDENLNKFEQEQRQNVQGDASIML